MTSVTERPGQHEDPGTCTLAPLLSARASERYGEIRFVAGWPMSATKIQKFRLRALLLK